MSICALYVIVCVCACGCLYGSEEGVRSPGARVTGRWELRGVGAGNHTWILGKRASALNYEPSLHPLISKLRKKNVVWKRIDQFLKF